MNENTEVTEPALKTVILLFLLLILGTDIYVNNCHSPKKTRPWFNGYVYQEDICYGYTSLEVGGIPNLIVIISVAYEILFSTSS